MSSASVSPTPDMPSFPEGSFEKAMLEVSVSRGHKYIVYKETTKTWTATADKADLASFRERFVRVAADVREKKLMKKEECILWRNFIQANRWNEVQDELIGEMAKRHMLNAGIEESESGGFISITVTKGTSESASPAAAAAASPPVAPRKAVESLRGRIQVLEQELGSVRAEYEALQKKIGDQEKEWERLATLQEQLNRKSKQYTDVLQRQYRALTQPQQELVDSLIMLRDYELRYADQYRGQYKDQYPELAELANRHLQVVQTRSQAKEKQEHLLGLKAKYQAVLYANQEGRQEELKKFEQEAGSRLAMLQKKQKDLRTALKSASGSREAEINKELAQLQQDIRSAETVLFRARQASKNHQRAAPEQIAQIKQKLVQVQSQLRLVNIELAAADSAYNAAQEVRLQVDKELRYDPKFKAFYDHISKLKVFHQMREVSERFPEEVERVIMDAIDKSILSSIELKKVKSQITTLRSADREDVAQKEKLAAVLRHKKRELSQARAELARLEKK